MTLIALIKTGIWTKAQDYISVIVITIGFQSPKYVSQFIKVPIVINFTEFKAINGSVLSISDLKRKNPDSIAVDFSTSELLSVFILFITFELIYYKTKIFLRTQQTTSNSNCI